MSPYARTNAEGYATFVYRISVINLSKRDQSRVLQFVERFSFPFVREAPTPSDLIGTASLLYVNRRYYLVSAAPNGCPFNGNTLPRVSRVPDVVDVDHPKSRPDNFGWNSAQSVAAAVLLARFRTIIPRTCGDFRRFSERCRNRTTGWWMMQSGANQPLHRNSLLSREK